jgi:hypothetical protein
VCVNEDNLMKDIKHCFEKGEWEDRGEITERVNLFKVHCLPLWNYHNDIPCTINIC